ncbi:hypothetical protein TNCV_3625321 [Trichonephila clavipes]|nr:hypothetical protein TNCV_3625321 [Trichonephila clavipes]
MVLEIYVRLLQSAMVPYCIFMDNNNTRSHRARIVGEFLEEEDIHRLDWSPSSMDLSHIEYIRDGPKRAISQHNSPPRSLRPLDVENCVFGIIDIVATSIY